MPSHDFVLDVLLQNMPGTAARYTTPLILPPPTETGRLPPSSDKHRTQPAAPPLLQPSTELISPHIRAAFVD